MVKEIETLKLRLILNKLTVILLLISIGAFGQSKDLYDHGLNENKWKDLREGIRYEQRENSLGKEWTYESKEEYEEERRRFESGDGSGNGSGAGDGAGNRPNENSQKRDYVPPPETTEIDSPDFSGLGPIGYILLGIFIIGIAVLIFFLFMNGERKGAIVGAPLQIDEVNPTEIPLTELERLLKEALDRGDYRGAIRIYFIFIVRDLAKKNWIAWEKEKTNMHYLREMSNRAEFEDFNFAVSYFEIIWYGKREIEKTRFELIQPKFTKLLSKLGVK